MFSLLDVFGNEKRGSRAWGRDSVMACRFFAAIVVLVFAARGASAQQTLTRNALSAGNNTLGNLSGWSTSGTASGITPTSITASDTLTFANWWTPGKLSSAQLWFDPADLGSVTTSGGLVSQLNNKASGSLTGGATVASQGSSGNRPTYNTSGANTLNGLPSMTFDGVSDVLTTNGSFTTGGWSQMTTVSVNSGTSFIYNYGYGGTPGGSMMLYTGTSVGFAGRPTGSGNSYLTASSPAVSLSNPTLGGISFLGTVTNNMVAYANGVAGTPASAVAGNLFQFAPGFQIGGATTINAWRAGNYGEVVVTNTASTTERQLLEGYMAWKWGTQSLLANDHPYKNAAPVSASETYYLGGNQSAAGLNFSGTGSATTLLGGTSGGAAANSMTIGSGGIAVSANAGATTLGQASGATVSLVVGADQTWSNSSAALLRAFNGISRATGDTTSRQLTIAGSGSTQLDGAIADGGVSGSLGLVKQGAGRLLLAGANTFTGSTTITDGTLALGAAGSVASPAISVGSGAAFDVSALTFTLGNGQSIGGKGSIIGNLVFGAGSKFVFSPGELLQLTLSSGSASFASTFGIADVLGLDGSTAEGTYTLLAGAVDFTNLTNVGSANAASIGSGKTAYFQQGSLQLVVVPEPGTITMAGLGAAVAAWFIRRRSAASR
jgi:autotransporter-associated beta strand protein